MSEDERNNDDDTGTVPTRPRPWRGLSGRVLLLTVVFVMLGEVLIYVPSIANFRVSWLQNRVAAAEVAALAVEAAPDRKVADDLRSGEMDRRVTRLEGH